MTTEKLYETLQSILKFDRELKLQAHLKAIGAALSNLVSAPASPPHQSALAVGLENFTSAVASLRIELSLSIAEAISAIGGEEFFDLGMAEAVRESVEKNAMTPSVASKFVDGLIERRAAFLATVRQTVEGLDQLGIEVSPLAPGTADVAFLIPRSLFDDDLGSFAKELKFIDGMIRDFSEAITGQPQSVVLETLSSSVPTVAILSAVSVLTAIAVAVNKYLDAWEKIEKIRTMREQLKSLKLSRTGSLNELTEEIASTVEEVISESTQVTMAFYVGDEGRKNELTSAIRRDTKRLFGQIERGLSLQFRAAPTEDEAEDEDEPSELRRLTNISQSLTFPTPTPEALLLTNGEVLEGEFATVVTVKNEKRVAKKAGKAV